LNRHVKECLDGERQHHSRGDPLGGAGFVKQNIAATRAAGDPNQRTVAAVAGSPDLRSDGIGGGGLHLRRKARPPPVRAVGHVPDKQQRQPGPRRRGLGKRFHHQGEV
jgi:hypothetical protein